MAKSWYLRDGKRRYGPIGSSKLKELAAEGRLTQQMQIAAKEAGPWHPISDLQGLQIAPAHSEPSAPPQIPPPPIRSPQDFLAVDPADVIVESDNRPPARSVAAKPVEQLLWTGRPSHWTNFLTYASCVFFFAVTVMIFPGVAVLFLGFAVWRWSELRCIRYELTTERLRLTEGLVSRSINEIELYRVKDTSFRQSIVQRMFGLGTIFLITSDRSSPNSNIRAIDSQTAMRLREEIRTYTERQRDRKGVKEIDYI